MLLFPREKYELKSKLPVEALRQRLAGRFVVPAGKKRGIFDGGRWKLTYAGELGDDGFQAKVRHYAKTYDADFEAGVEWDDGPNDASSSGGASQVIAGKILPAEGGAVVRIGIRCPPQALKIYYVVMVIAVPVALLALAKLGAQLAGGDTDAVQWGLLLAPALPLAAHAAMMIPFLFGRSRNRAFLADLVDAKTE